MKMTYTIGESLAIDFIKYICIEMLREQVAKKLAQFPASNDTVAWPI